MIKLHALAMPDKKMFLFAGAGIVGMLFVGFLAPVNAQTIMQQLSLGARGNEVIKLQTFLAQDRTIYPEGIISGYYGPLTQKAVVQLQVSYGLPQAGRVGPLTIARINAAITSGLGLDVNAPIIGNVTLQPTRGGATIIWTSNESARAMAYYDASPLILTEAQTMLEMPLVSGTAMTNDSGLRTAHSVTIQGLQPGTVYHYVTKSTDASGNATFTWPATFRTQD